MKHDFIDKYSNLSSVVHKIDPMVKLLLLFCFLIFIAVGILLRSMDRSDYIYKAMLSRGFDGEFPGGNSNRLKWTDLAVVIVFLGIIVTTRILRDM